MKRWICGLLALMLLLGAAGAEGLGGLRQTRPALGTQTEAPPAEPAPELKYELALPDAEPSAQSPGDIDLRPFSEDELYLLIERIYDELELRESPVYGKSIDDGLVLIDRDGVRLAVFNSNYDEDTHRLRFDVLVENGTDGDISISVNEPVADGISVYALGIYGVPAGETVYDYFYFEPDEIDADVDAVLGNVQNLSFAFEVWESESYETLFLENVTLNAA